MAYSYGGKRARSTFELVARDQASEKDYGSRRVNRATYSGSMDSYSGITLFSSLNI